MPDTARPPALDWAARQLFWERRLRELEANAAGDGPAACDARREADPVVEIGHRRRPCRALPLTR